MHLRMFAWLIDKVVIYLYLYFMQWVFQWNIHLAEAAEYGLAELLVVLPITTYHLITEVFMNGQSIGKLLFGIMVVSSDGRSASFSQYLIRWLLRLLDLGFFIGLAMILMQGIFMGILFIAGSILSGILLLSTNNHQRLGDWVAGTVVVLKKNPFRLNDTIFQELNSEAYRVMYPEVMKLTDRDINIINNALQRHRRVRINKHLDSIAMKVMEALNIHHDQTSFEFLNTLMKDYNYLTRNKSEDEVKG